MAFINGECMHFRSQEQEWDEADISFGSIMCDSNAFDKATCIYAEQEVIK
jgi:hypothetical protein